MKTRFFLYAVVGIIGVTSGFIASGDAYAGQAIGTPLGVQLVSPVSGDFAIMLVNGRHHGWHRGWHHGRRFYPYPYPYYGPNYGGGYYYAPYSPSFCPNPQTWDSSLGQWVCTP